MKSFIPLCLLLVGCAGLTSVQHVKESDYRITGKLDKNEYDEIISIVKKHPNENLNFYVSSIGGTSNDLFECMDTMYMHGHVNWYVLNQCDSACAILALSTKHAYGTYRLHSFYKHEDHHVYAAPDFNEKVMSKLRSYGYNTDKIHHMFNSVDVMWDITLKDGEIVNE
jgi:hypothetical protein